jgi:hypothetical protein
MTITLNDQEVKDILHNAFSSAGHFHYGAMSMQFDAKEYAASRQTLSAPCREDVWVKMLEDGRKLILCDHEDDDKLHIFGLSDAKAALEKLPINILSDFIEENYDADTADYVLEYIMYGEKIYG